VLRYIQTHPLNGDVSPVQNADFDGTAEIWFDSLEGMRAVFASRTYREQVFPDEKTFLDHGKTLTLIGDQVQFIPGREAHKPAATGGK
jgi:hypothetical protein